MDMIFFIIICLSLINLFLLISLYRLYQEMKSEKSNKEELYKLVVKRGLMLVVSIIIIIVLNVAYRIVEYM